MNNTDEEEVVSVVDPRLAFREFDSPPAGLFFSSFLQGCPRNMREKADASAFSVGMAMMPAVLIFLSIATSIGLLVLE